MKFKIFLKTQFIKTDIKMENLNIVRFIKEIKSVLKDLPMKCQAQRFQWQILKLQN